MLLAAAENNVCTGSSKTVCNWVYDWTNSEPLAKAAAWLVDRPLRVALIFLVAYLVVRVVRRAVNRFVETMIKDRENRLAEWQAAHEVEAESEGIDLMARRRKALAMVQTTAQSKQRAQTLGSIMRSTAAVVIYTVAFMMALAQLDVELAPLIASAGIAGVALGFGAQSIVKDFLSGFFILVEDQYSVGDIIDVGEASGVVEGITMRTTKIRSVDGTLWFIPHGEISRVANKSQMWARAVLDIEVAYDTDIDHAKMVIKEVADQVWHDSGADTTIIEEPEIWGVETFGESSISIRLVVKTEPGEQWSTAREIRARLIKAFAREGIEIPFPQRVIWTKSETT